MPGDAPALDADTISALLRECVTVVKPGEVLVVRIDPGDGYTPGQVHEMAEALFYASVKNDIRSMLVFGHEMAVAEPVPATVRNDDEVFAARVARALGSRQVRDAIRRECLRENAAGLR